MALVKGPMTRPPSTLKAATPFRFYTSFVLEEATGLRATTLPTLARLIRNVPEGCIYHHTHYFLLSHHYLTPEPANDFAYWVSEVLGEEPLGERLASIDTLEHSTLHSLREALAGTIEAYLGNDPTARLKFVSDGEAFFFIKSVHLIMPTSYEVSTLPEFAHALSQISIRSLYFHVFDARLRVGRRSNDFAMWLEEQLGLRELAERVATLDPYAHTLETLRSLLLSLIQDELSRQPTGHVESQ